MAKILVVEDDQFLILAYRSHLGKAGFEVNVARDGEEAMVTLRSYRPDVILLDLVMPRVDGFQLLEQIKKNTALASIPVIVASNLGERTDIDRANELGASEYIVKTDLSMEDLVGKINTLLANAV